QDAYALFRNTGDKTKFNVVPLRLVLAKDEAGQIAFGLIHTGYSKEDPAGRTVAVTLTTTFATSPQEIQQLTMFLRSATGIPSPSLTPVASVKVRLGVVTGSQREAGTAFKLLDEFTMPVGATHAVTFALDGAKPG